MKKKQEKSGSRGLLCLLAGFLASGLWSVPVMAGWEGNSRDGWRLVEQGEEKKNSWHWDGAWWYHLGPSGRMDTGWLQENGQWYYLLPEPGGPEGSAAWGWRKIEGKWYYFHPVHDGNFGRMEADLWVDGCLLGPDGAWTGEQRGDAGRRKTGSGAGSGGSSSRREETESTGDGAGKTEAGSAGDGAGKTEAGSAGDGAGKTEPESAAGQEKAEPGEEQPPALERLAFWEETAGQADSELLKKEVFPGHEWLVENRKENDSRISGILSAVRDEESHRFYLIGVNYQPESLVFGSWPEFQYTFQEEDRFEAGGNQYTVTGVTVNKIAASEEEPGERHWREGEIQERMVGSRKLRFRCVDSEYRSGGEVLALFLCEEVIPADEDSDEFVRRVLSFGENSSYKTSRVRSWLQENGRDLQGIAAVSTGVTRAYTGETRPGTFEDLDLDQLKPEEIGAQNMEDYYFSLSLEEAIRYREELWTFEDGRGPESQLGPCCEGYWLRTPVYGEGKDGFAYGGEVYIVDLDEGCIRPASVDRTDMGIRPAYGAVQE